MRKVGMASSMATIPMRCKRFVLVTLGTVVAGTCSALAAEIPVEVIFQRAQYGEIQLSPDGRYLAIVARLRGRNNLAVMELEKRDAKPITNFTDADVVQFRWLNNKRLLYAAGDALEASGRGRFFGWSAVDRDGSRLEKLGSIGSYVGPATSGADDIVVLTGERAHTTVDVYRLGTYHTNKQLLSYDRPADVLGYVVDHNDVPRLARSRLNGVSVIWYRESGDSPWTKLEEGTDLKLNFTPLAFDYDNKTLYVSARGDSDRLGIYTYDFKSKKLGELIVGSPQADIYTLVFSPAKRALIGVRFQADRPGVVWFDHQMIRLQQIVDKALPDTFNVLRVADENPRRAVVFTYSDVNPGVVYLLDTEKLTLEELVKLRPWLEAKQMAERKPVHYAARDGLDIPAYLTLPKISSDRKPPLILIIHGGPWARGTEWGFDTLAQFFASRGYAVLEPEFRGSVGHGWKLYSSSFKQWGLAMQDDIADGAEWLIREGIVDKDRICLFGGSYGGYATLWGLIKTPGLYRCGVAYVAVTDVSMLFDLDWNDLGVSPYKWLDYEAKVLIGDPKTDGEKFRSVSPLYNADKLAAPVLLAYGGLDPRVPIKHGTAFRDALDKSGKTYEWVVYRDEAHGFNKDENRFDFYRRVDAFLKKYLQ
jgi:dipeptidyl aminopeptidase/acylaminoacyl peptidase